MAPEHVPAALEVLETRLGATDPALENGTITVIGADRETIPDLVASLVGAGVRIYGITPQEPSLEDVYFSLHGEEVRG